MTMSNALILLRYLFFAIAVSSATGFANRNDVRNHFRIRRQTLKCATPVFAAMNNDECLKEKAVDHGTHDESSDAVRCCKFDNYWQCVNKAAVECGQAANNVTDSILLAEYPEEMESCRSYQLYPGQCFYLLSSWHILTAAVVFSIFTLVCCVGSCYFCQRKTHHYEPATGNIT